jgi:hypothetical protein
VSFCSLASWPSYSSSRPAICCCQLTSTWLVLEAPVAGSAGADRADGALGGAGPAVHGSKLPGKDKMPDRPDCYAKRDGRGGLTAVRAWVVTEKRTCVGRGAALHIVSAPEIHARCASHSSAARLVCTCASGAQCAWGCRLDHSARTHSRTHRPQVDLPGPGL